MPENDNNVSYAIKVTDAYKSYGDNNILNGINMCVPSGYIYGLLGASGCGKSTLLECILGKMTLDSGGVYVETNSLRDIGYMPQDLCLEQILTIKELLEYYGSLYGMTKNEIERKIEFLTNLLELPEINQYIKNLSGGQLRRVSLAVCIFHDPKIIILDEPTVGVDTLLRQKIWDEFSKMVSDGKKTIIITTHYIEEATKAHCVGLMRNGVLVEEGEPQQILLKCETDSLESAFLSICCKQEEQQTVQHNIRDVQRKDNSFHTQNTLLTKREKPICFKRIRALFMKYKSCISRDYLFIMTVMVLPIIMSVGICLSIGSDIKNLKIAVNNDEIESLSDCRKFKIDGCIMDDTYNQTISCIVVNYLLSRDYKLIEVKNRDVGDKMVKNYEALGFLYFSQNYTNYFSYYMQNIGGDEVIESQVYMNVSGDKLLEKNQFVKDVMDSIKLVTEKTLNKCSLNPKILSSPVNIYAMFGKTVKTVLDGVASMFFTTQSFFFNSTFAVCFMLSERMDGLFSRSMMAGVRIMDLLISLFFLCNIFYMLHLIPSVFIFYVLFGHPILINGSIIMVIIAIILVGWIGFFYGILIAGIFPSKLGCTFAEQGMFMAQVSLSGFVWPIDGEIQWLRPISKIMPAYLAGNTINNIGLKGYTWDHPLVLHDVTLMVIELVVLILLIFGLDKIKKNMWILNK